MSRTCHLCGKQFHFWDERQDFSFSRHVGYGSKYDRTDIALNLCCHCFDKVMDWLLPQCAVDPVCGERGSGLPIKALLEGDFVAEAESLMRSLPETQDLSYSFRAMWMHDWGVYAVKGMGYCTDPCIRLPRSIEMTATYDEQKKVYRPVVEVGKRAFACERRLEGAVLTAISEIGAEAFDECCSLRSALRHSAVVRSSKRSSLKGRKRSSKRSWWIPRRKKSPLPIRGSRLKSTRSSTSGTSPFWMQKFIITSRS